MVRINKDDVLSIIREHERARAALIADAAVAAPLAMKNTQGNGPSLHQNQPLPCWPLWPGKALSKPIGDRDISMIFIVFILCSPVEHSAFNFLVSCVHCVIDDDALRR